MGYAVYKVLVYHDKHLFYEFHPNLYRNDKRDVLQEWRDWKFILLKRDAFGKDAGKIILLFIISGNWINLSVFGKPPTIKFLLTKTASNLRVLFEGFLLTQDKIKRMLGYFLVKSANDWFLNNPKVYRQNKTYTRYSNGLAQFLCIPSLVCSNIYFNSDRSKWPQYIYYAV